MPRFYFNVVMAEQTVEDNEGTELSSLAEARAEALHDARGLMSAAILRGYDISSRHITICNANGEVLLRVPFSEAYGRKD